MFFIFSPTDKHRTGLDGGNESPELSLLCHKDWWRLVRANDPAQTEWKKKATRTVPIRVTRERLLYSCMQLLFAFALPLWSILYTTEKILTARRWRFDSALRCTHMAQAPHAVLGLSITRVAVSVLAVGIVALLIAVCGILHGALKFAAAWLLQNRVFLFWLLANAVLKVAVQRGSPDSLIDLFVALLVPPSYTMIDFLCMISPRLRRVTRLGGTTFFAVTVVTTFIDYGTHLVKSSMCRDDRGAIKERTMLAAILLFFASFAEAAALMQLFWYCFVKIKCFHHPCVRYSQASHVIVEEIAPNSPSVMILKPGLIRVAPVPSGSAQGGNDGAIHFRFPGQGSLRTHRALAVLVGAWCIFISFLVITDMMGVAFDPENWCWKLIHRNSAERAVGYSSAALQVIFLSFWFSFFFFQQVLLVLFKWATYWGNQNKTFIALCVLQGCSSFPVYGVGGFSDFVNYSIGAPTILIMSDFLLLWNSTKIFRATFFFIYGFTLLSQISRFVLTAAESNPCTGSGKSLSLGKFLLYECLLAVGPLFTYRFLTLLLRKLVHLRLPAMEMDFSERFTDATAVLDSAKEMSSTANDTCTTAQAPEPAPRI